MRMEEKAKTSYMLGHEERELERLEGQAAVWEPATRRALAAVGVPVGAHCLDVGCGTGSVMRMLAELVGETGRVIGADANAELGRLAIARLNTAGRARFEFQALDVTATDNAVEETYDLVFARLLLCHLTDPVGALARMWSWVAPGGTLVVQDYDQTVAGPAQDCEAVRDGLRFVTAAFAATGKSPRIGTEVSGHFVRAGIGVPDGVDVYGQVVAARVGCAMLAGIMRSVAPTIAEHRIAPHDRFVATLDAVDALAADPGLMVRIPDMVATWKRRPV